MTRFLETDGYAVPGFMLVHMSNLCNDIPPAAVVSEAWHMHNDPSLRTHTESWGHPKQRNETKNLSVSNDVKHA